MITPEQVEAAIAAIHTHHLPHTTTVVCGLVLTNGHVVIGEAHCAKDTPFNPALGKQFARQDAERKVAELLAFQQRGLVG